MVTHETKLKVLYEVEQRIMDILTTKAERDSDVGWTIVYEMIEEEFKARDAYSKSLSEVLT